MDYLKLATEVEDYVIKCRRHLHMYPEISTKEDKTIAFVEKELASMSIRYDHVVDGGVIGYIDGDLPGQTILLRADVDALPMQEEDYNLSKPRTCKSRIDGVSHTCGHDGHTAMLLGAAKALCGRTAQIKGRILLFFERGEEGGGNIYYMLKYLADNHIAVDAAWGIHVHSGLPTGKMAMMPGASYAGMLGFDVQLTGKGGHGARPDMCINPIDCFAAIHLGLSSIKNRVVDAGERLTHTVCMVEGGNAGNIIPNQVRFGGTCRFYSIEQGGKVFREELIRLVENTAAAYNCTAQFLSLGQPGLPLHNNPRCVQIARKCVEGAIGTQNVLDGEAKMGSESMAQVAYYYPTVFAWLGINNPEIGSGADHHNPKFDLDEEALKYGVASTMSYALGFLAEPRQDLGFKAGDMTIEQLRR